jgi:integrase
MQVKLTPTLVQKLTEKDPPTKDTHYFDVQLPRFYLRVKPPRVEGLPWASAYFVRYTIAGEDRRMKVGNPNTMDLDQARAAAKEKLARADLGQDPAAQRQADRAAWTVREAVAAYRASPEFADKSDKGRDIDSGILDNHILSRLAGEKLAAIDVPAIRRLMRQVKGDTRVNSRRRRLGGPGIARKVVRVLSSLMTWCVGEGRLERNPIPGNLRLSGDGERDTVMVEPEQYLALLRAVDDLVSEGALRPVVRAFFIVKAFTGMRRGEIQTLRRGQVDLAARRITLTGTKGQRLAKGKGPKTETVGLPPIAASAIAEILPAAGVPEDLVFPPLRGERLSVNRDWRLVRTRAKLPGDMVLHGLRHSAGTVAIMAGLSLPEVQKLLRHRNVTTTQRYIHLAEAARAGLQDRALGHLAPGAAVAEVLPLKRS